MARTTTRALAALLLMSCPAACQTRAPDPARVQEALRTGAVGALAAHVAQASPPSADELPRATVIDGVVRFEADASHQQIQAVRDGDRLAVTWTDAARAGVWLGVAGLRGEPRGAARRVYEAVSGEERADAPAVLPTSEGFAVAWVDAENGRVLFRRLDAQRGPVGAVVIVHEGLESPRAVSLVRGEGGFGLAATLWQGVYFAQLDASGTRVGDGAMLSEGEAVTALHALRWDRDAYTVAFSTAQGARVERRVVSLRAARAAQRPVG